MGAAADWDSNLKEVHRKAGLEVDMPRRQRRDRILRAGVRAFPEDPSCIVESEEMAKDLVILLFCCRLQKGRPVGIGVFGDNLKGMATTTSKSVER